MVKRVGRHRHLRPALRPVLVGLPRPAPAGDAAGARRHARGRSTSSSSWSSCAGCSRTWTIDLSDLAKALLSMDANALEQLIQQAGDAGRGPAHREHAADRLLLAPDDRADGRGGRGRGAAQPRGRGCARRAVDEDRLGALGELLTATPGGGAAGGPAIHRARAPEAELRLHRELPPRDACSRRASTT